MLDAKKIAFVDFTGDRQFITTGNLAENEKAYLFLIDCEQRRRVKIWGKARVPDDDAAMTAALLPPGYRARAEQVIVFSVSAWDANCPQHIPQRFEASVVAAALAARDEKIAALEAQVAQMQLQ